MEKEIIKQKLKDNLFLAVVLAVIFWVAISVPLFRLDDDMSFLRAASYLFFDHQALTQAKSELAEVKNEIGSISLSRYEARYNSVAYYISPILLMRVFEVGPLYSVFQSPILALLVLQIFSVSIFLFIIFRFLRKDAWVILVALIFSLVPKFILYPRFFPYESPGFLWYDGVSRSMAVFLFAALLFVLTFVASKRKKIFLSVFLILFIVSLNYPFSLVIFGPFALAMIAKKVFSKVRINKKRLIWIFCSVVAGFCFVKVAVILAFGASALEIIKVARPWAIFWLLATLYLLIKWLDLKDESVKNEKLRFFGNKIFYLLAVFGVLSCGFTIIGSIPDLQFNKYIALTAFFEFCQRTSGVSHLLWWILFSILVYFRYGQSSIFKKIIYLAAIFIFFNQSFNFLGHLMRNHEHIFDKNLLQAMFRDKSGPEKYADEIYFYQALANDLRAKRKNLK